MLRNTKTKILSLLVTICMLTSTFIVPMTASAANPAVYPVSTNPAIIQVVSPDLKSFPAGSTSSSNPTLVNVVTSVAGASFDATSAFYATPAKVKVMNSTFADILAGTTIQSSVGSDDYTSGGTVFYLRVEDSANAGTFYYYKVTAFSPKSNAATLAPFTDATNIATPAGGVVTPGAGNTSSAPTTFSIVLASGKTSFARSLIVTGESSSVLTIYTDAAYSAVFAGSDITAADYYIMVQAQDGSKNYWKMTVTNASSNDTALSINPKNAIVSGGNTAATNLGVTAATTTYVNLPAGNYIITNANSELFSIHTAGQGTVISTIYAPLGVAGAAAHVAGFTQSITTGDYLSIAIAVTAPDGTTATHTIIYTVYEYGITGVRATGITNTQSEFVNIIPAAAKDGTVPIAIHLGLSVGSGTISDLSTLFNYYGFSGTSIEFSTNADYAPAHIISSVTVPVGAPTTILARVRTNPLNNAGGTPQTGTYVYYSIAISRTADANIIITKAPSSTAKVTDSLGNVIEISSAAPKYNGKFDTSIAAGDGSLGVNCNTAATSFTIKVIVDAPAKLSTILNNLVYKTSSLSVNPSYFIDNTFTTPRVTGVDPYLTFTNTTTLYVKAQAESGVFKFFTIVVSVESISAKAAISTIKSTLGTSTIVAGNLDSTTPSTLTITALKSLTTISASDFTAAEFGTFRLFANAADMTDNTKAILSSAIAPTINTAAVYASVTSGNGAVVRYFKIVINKVDATTQYQISTPGFVKVGSNQIATVTVDRALAAKLNAPKVFVIYTLADGETMVYQTLDLAVSDTTATTQIVCGAGFSHVQACVIDGNLDWTVGIPDVMSAQFIDLDVPAIG